MLILEGPWFWWLVGTVTVCWRPVFHIFFPFLFYFLSRTCTLWYPSILLCLLFLSLFDTCSHPLSCFLFLRLWSYAVLFYFFFSVVCSLTHLFPSLIHVGPVSLGTSPSLSVIPLLLLPPHLCLFVYYKQNNPWEHLPLSLSVSPPSNLLSLGSLSWFMPTVFVSLSPSHPIFHRVLYPSPLSSPPYTLSHVRDSSFCFSLSLSLTLWLNHRAIHWSFKSLSFGAQTAKFTRGFF